MINYNYGYAFTTVFTFTGADTQVLNTQGKPWPMQVLGVEVYKSSGSPSLAYLTMWKDFGVAPSLDKVDALSLTKYEPFFFKPRGIQCPEFAKNEACLLKMQVDAAATFYVTLWTNVAV